MKRGSVLGGVMDLISERVECGAIQLMRECVVGEIVEMMRVQSVHGVVEFKRE